MSHLSALKTLIPPSQAGFRPRLSAITVLTSAQTRIIDCATRQKY